MKKILIYDTHIHPLSDLDQSNCGPGTIIRDISAWVINTLIVMEIFPAGITPDQGAKHAIEDMDTGERHAEAAQGESIHAHVGIKKSWLASRRRNGKALAFRQNTLKGRPSEGATSPKGAHVAPQWITPISSTRIRPRDYFPWRRNTSRRAEASAKSERD